MKILAIFDTAVEGYMRPFFAQSIGSGIRAFADLAQDPEHPVGAHPEDYHLFSLGEFDDRTGEIHVNQAPQRVSSAVEFMARGPQAVPEAIDA